MEIKDLLKEHVLEIEFTKTDGTSRTVKATLIQEHIPQMVSENTQKKTPNANVTCFWSIDDSGWRSFRNDSVLSYSILE